MVVSATQERLDLLTCWGTCPIQKHTTVKKAGLSASWFIVMMTFFDTGPTSKRHTANGACYYARNIWRTCSMIIQTMATLMEWRGWCFGLIPSFCGTCFNHWNRDCSLTRPCQVCCSCVQLSAFLVKLPWLLATLFWVVLFSCCVGSKAASNMSNLNFS